MYYRVQPRLTLQFDTPAPQVLRMFDAWRDLTHLLQVPRSGYTASKHRFRRCGGWQDLTHLMNEPSTDLTYVVHDPRPPCPGELRVIMAPGAAGPPCRGADQKRLPTSTPPTKGRYKTIKPGVH